MPMQQQATAWVTGNVAYAPDPQGSDRNFRVRLRVLSNRRWYDREQREWKQGEASGTDVVCWGDLAHNVAASIQVGDPVVAYGRLEESSWTDADGKSNRRSRLVADLVAHDLSRGAARFQKLNFNAAGSATGATGTDGAITGAEETPEIADGGTEYPSGELAGPLAEDGGGADPWNNSSAEMQEQGASATAG